MARVRIGSREYEAEVLRTDGKVQVAIPELGSMAELVALFAGANSMELDGERMDGYEVDCVALMRSADADLWDGKRATIVLREVG